MAGKNELQKEIDDGELELEILDIEELALEEQQEDFPERNEPIVGRKKHTVSHNKSDIKNNKYANSKRTITGRRGRSLRVLKITLAVFFLIVATGFLGWQMLIVSGKNSLYRKGGTMNTELLAQLDTNAQVADIGWEEGWIRYDGSIYKYNDEIITLLVLGIDKDSENEESAHGLSGGQSDANFLVVINPDKETVQLICINRDTMAEYQTYDYYGSKDAVAKAQLCLAHAYGNSPQQNCENSVDAVSKLFYGLPIHGYCSINMAGIPVLNDAVGGVTVNCLQSFSTNGYRYTKGQDKTLKGMGAFWYVKYRDTKEFNSNGDRLERQKQYLNAFIDKAKTSLKKNPSLIAGLYEGLAAYMTTDITLDEASYLAGTALGYSFDMDNVISLKGETVQGTYYEEFYPDEEALQKLIIDIFYEEVAQE